MTVTHQPSREAFIAYWKDYGGHDLPVSSDARTAAIGLARMPAARILVRTQSSEASLRPDDVPSAESRFCQAYESAVLP